MLGQGRCLRFGLVVSCPECFEPKTQCRSRHPGSCRRRRFLRNRGKGQPDACSNGPSSPHRRPHSQTSAPCVLSLSTLRRLTCPRETRDSVVLDAGVRRRPSFCTEQNTVVLSWLIEMVDPHRR